MLALPPSDPSLYEESETGVVVFASNSLLYVERSSSESDEEEKIKTGKSKNKKKGKGRKESSDSDYDDAEEQKMMKDKFHEEWEKKRKNRTDKELDTNALLVDDHYHVLGLEDLGMSATEQHIKTAYRKLALVYHPDKKRGGAAEEDDGKQDLNPEEKVKKEIWLKVQKAYETLMDPEKRRKYDSSLPFDESVPKEDDVNEENFFDVFTEVFNRNAIWAKNKPVPQLGNEKTPLKKVLKFYKYWDTFETSRDFSCHDEYDLDEAADKWEKKYMDKENKKIREKYIKTERARLNELYRIAYRNDPRIKAYQEQQEKEKELKKKEKFDKKQKVRDEKLKRELEIKQRKEEEERKIQEAEEMERKKVEIQKQLRSSLISKLKNLADQKLKKFHYEYDQFFVDEFVKKLKDEDIKAIVEATEAMEDTEAGFEKIKGLIEQKKEEGHQRIKQQQQKDKAKREEKKSAVKEWTKDEFAFLVKALNKFPAGTQDRWRTIATFMGASYTSKDIIEMTRQLTEKKTLANAGKGAFKSEPEKIIKSKGGDKEETKENGAAQDDGWTEDEQKKLEEALKKYPKTLPPKERWGGIASEIPGKTAKECLARFKHI